MLLFRILYAVGSTPLDPNLVILFAESVLDSGDP